MHSQNTYRTTIAQTNPVVGDVSTNIEAAEEILSKARVEGSDLVVFPELFLTGYHIGSEADELTDEAHEAIGLLRQYSEDLVVVMGTPLHSDSGIRNSALVLDDGAILGRYHKTHLWGDEPGIFEAGSEFPTFDTSVGTLGIQICYDVEFPEVSRMLTMNGADTLVTISANMRPCMRDQELYHGARALENGRSHVLCNRVGEERGVDFFGRSGIVNHRGRRILSLGADIVETSSARIPIDPDRSMAHDYLDDRRPELYQL